jgi:hypothetical protein
VEGVVEATQGAVAAQGSADQARGRGYGRNSHLQCYTCKKLTSVLSAQ